ncbi:MAG: hypothetical protein ACLPSW_11750 [Roseiarcus sp.]
MQLRNRGGASARRGGRALAAPRISKQFQVFCKLFQGKSKENPRISKLFQTFSLAVSFDVKGLRAESPVLRFSCSRRRSAACPDAIGAILNSSQQRSAASDFLEENVARVRGRPGEEIRHPRESATVCT